MKLVNRLSDLVFTVEKIISIILMIVMVVSISLQVVYRYFLNDPLSWPEELAIFMLIWVTFIGGSMSIKRQQAAAVALFIDRIGPLWRKILLIFGFAIITVFCLFIFYLSIQWVTNPTSFLKISPTLGIQMFYPYLAIPIGFICMSIHSLDLLFKTISSSDQVVE